jgi:predicted secreted protein
MRIVFGLILCVIFFSCEKKELPAPKYDRGDVQSMQINMSSDYKNQVWVSLSKNEVISTNVKTDWDLSFENSSTGFHVLMNTALSSKIYKTNHSQLQDVTDTLGIGVYGLVDAASGNFDSTAIGNWQLDNKVYVIERGYNELGQNLGYYKIKFLSVTPSQYVFEYCKFNSAQTYTGTVTKDDQYNFSYYSLATHQQKSIEPKKSEYDLCFTQYTHTFVNPFQLYLVTGALINTSSTRVIQIFDVPFSDITINDTTRTFYNKKNIIGYEWKTVDINTGLYTLNTQMCYIISDSKGFYYKLHFIDFYNSSGIKGYPLYEFKKL